MVVVPLVFLENRTTGTHTHTLGALVLFMYVCGLPGLLS